MKRLLILLCLLWAVPVSAAGPYYVSNGTNGPVGLDSRNCTVASTITTPKLTLASGMSCLHPGETLYVRGGTYDEQLFNPLVGHSGTDWTSSGKVVISAYQTETVTLKPTNFAVTWVIYFGASDQQYIEFIGINIDSTLTNWGGMRIESTSSGNPHHIRFTYADVVGGPNSVAEPELQEPQNIAVTQRETGQQGGNEFRYLTVHGGGDSGEHYYGFYINADNTVVDHCEIYNVRGIGLQVYSAYETHNNPLNVTVSNNKIHDVIVTSPSGRSSGIIMDSGTGHTMFNNVIYSLAGGANSAGIRVYGANQSVINNTVYGNSSSTGIDVRSTATDAIVNNNISYGNGANTTDSYCGNDSTQDNFCNLGTRTNQGITATNLIAINPDVTNAAAFDFSIKTTSPAKDTGTTYALVTVDIIGTARPQNSIYDIGAYEFAGAAPDPDVDTPATGTIFVSDTFTDATSGKNLVTGPHIGETGATWAIQSGATAGMVISDNNRLRGGTIDVTTNSYASGTPVSTEYDVNVPVHTFTTVSGHVIGVWGRMIAAARTGYVGIYNLNPGTLELWMVNNYVYTQLGTACTPSFADGSDHTIRLEIRNSIKKLYYDSTLCTKSTDNTLTAPGLAGLDIYTPTTAATNSTSFHFSSIEARDVQTATPPPPVTTYYRFRFKR